METVDCVVIGAGVVGLACARALAQSGCDVLVLETEKSIGTGTSSRNSEVVHAGIYYPAGSLKAELCVSGRAMLYAYCAERDIVARRCGKLIVATRDNHIDALHRLETSARRNGVDDLVWLTADEVHAREPAVSCVGALLSPSSGIVDSHALMLSLQGDLEERGGMVAFAAPVLGGRAGEDGIVLDVGGDAPMLLRCRTLVNAAGLFAPAIAGLIEGMPAAAIPRAYFAKGNYYALSGVRNPFSSLIYPVPEQAGLGIHATIDLGGQVKFGPDVEWIDAIDYTVDPARADSFYAAIRRYWPGLPDGALTPSYSGIRPKIVDKGEAAADFVIQGEAEHGVCGLVNLFGIESPGLTSCLAIAQKTEAMLAEFAPA